MKIQNIPASIGGFERFLIIVLSLTGCYMAHLLFTCLCYIDIKDVTALVWSCVCMFAGRLKYEHKKCYMFCLCKNSTRGQSYKVR